MQAQAGVPVPQNLNSEPDVCSEPKNSRSRGSLYPIQAKTGLDGGPRPALHSVSSSEAFLSFPRRNAERTVLAVLLLDFCLREDRKQVAEVRLVGRVSQQRRDAEDFLERPQRGAVRVVDAVGIAIALSKR